MTAERRTSALVGGRHLSGEEIRNQKFSAQLFGGYSPDEVNRFMGKVAHNTDWLYEQLEQANTRAARAEAAAAQATQQFPVQMQAPATDQSASLRLLQAAQASADTAVAEAQHRADDMQEHARQQAERILAEARQHASISARQIINDATAASRAQVARNLELAEKIRSGLHRGAMTLHALLGEWAQEAGPEVTDVVHAEPPAEPAAADEPDTSGSEPASAGPAPRRRSAAAPKQS